MVGWGFLKGHGLLSGCALTWLWFDVVMVCRKRSPGEFFCDFLCLLIINLVRITWLFVFKMIFGERELAVCISKFVRDKYVCIEMSHPHSIMMFPI